MTVKCDRRTFLSMMKKSWGALVLIVLLPALAEARMDYAVRFNNISCQSCHYSPVGGGPRNHNGKLFQNRWFKTNPFKIQDFVSGDFRALNLYPENPKTAKGGMGVMSGSVAAHIPLDEKGQDRVVIEQNIAGFSAAPLRDTYYLHKFNSKKLNNWVESLAVGRFRSPFGIVTDEHRTYTKIQTGTRWFDFQTGLLLSGNPSSQIHYDLALVNGQNSDGSTVKTGQAQKWGQIFNIRYMPSFFMVGASASQFNTSQSYNSHAWSAYSVISLARLNYRLFPATIKLEYTQAKGFNSILNQGYISDPNYGTAVANSTSEGFLARVDWMITGTFILVYKYDRLLPDKNYTADLFERHGFGIRWMFRPSMYLITRSEFGRATQPSEVSKVGRLAQDANYIILEALF